jgi:ribosomal protein S13
MEIAPAMSISSEWLKFIENQQSQAQTKLLYQHLLQRSELTLGKIKNSLHQHLQQEAVSLEKGLNVTDVKISLPIFQNQKLDQALAKAFSTTHRFYPKLFNKKLGESTAKDGAVIQLQVANEEGNIIRSYQRGETKKRPIAGLSTLVISSLLLSLNDDPKTRYCNKSYAGIRNANEPLREGLSSCKTLSRKGHSFSLQQSISEGKVLPLLYALTQTHKLSSTALIKLYKDFSLSSEPFLNLTSNVKKLAYELSIGSVKSTPQNVHAMIHALTRHLYGIPYDSSPAIIESLEVNQLVSIVSLKGQQQQKIEYSSRRSLGSSSNRLEEYLSNQSSRRHMKSLFTIPITKKNNPLKFLRSVEKKYGVDFLLVKSATSKTSGGKTKDKWLVGSVRLKQHIYSFMIMIGSKGSDGGLGKRISHQQLMLPVINEMIESLQR